jgi:hypothetical protein
LAASRTIRRQKIVPSSVREKTPFLSSSRIQDETLRLCCPVIRARSQMEHGLSPTLTWPRGVAVAAIASSCIQKPCAAMLHWRNVGSRTQSFQ